MFLRNFPFCHWNIQNSNIKLTKEFCSIVRWNRNYPSLSFSYLSPTCSRQKKVSDCNDKRFTFIYLELSLKATKKLSEHGGSGRAKIQKFASGANYTWFNRKSILNRTTVWEFHGHVHDFKHLKWDLVTDLISVINLLLKTSNNQPFYLKK